jgi:hypothetical protein
MGKYHCTVDLLFDLFGLVCFVNKNKNCQLSYSRFQTSQTGGQQYSDTSPLVCPGLTIIIYDRNDIASTIKLNYNCKALASVINYDCKRDALIWSINLTSSFMIVICL